mmetsp:Transcript_95435/g.165744  ORF Transcript_95435/g.165744 Transcript_95435/m.165744 type:complete len:244 (-) Transcript_95435:88-819(-)
MAPKPREIISRARVTGVIKEWKGKFGWIEPTKPVPGEKGGSKGRVYLAIEDVEEELEGIGATVSFILYKDKSGVGAAECKGATAAAQAPKAPAQKPMQASAKAKGGSAKGGSSKGGSSWAEKGQKPMQASAKAKGGKSWGKEASKEAEPPAKKAKTDGGKGAGAGARQVIHDERIMGTITAWKGTFGWVKPEAEIDHPKASAKGDVYLALEDVEEELEGVGAAVSFMLYEDKRGLGACEVRCA